MLRISTIQGRKRMSTQDLLQTISRAVENGETDFHIQASGQHDIGGPLWNREGENLRFTIINPGQRVGSMCLPGTHIVVEGSAPADVGWLNSGSIISVRGDAGDTAGHCAACGKIYIGGRAGVRSGSLMKHDPELDEPELWILKSTGSFSFEFMGGGRAVVCGHDSQTMQSVLGERPCVGMVGGTVYFRGPAPLIPADAKVLPLSAEDIAWLDLGLDTFLEEIAQPKLKRELSLWKHWRKLVPCQEAEEKPPLDMKKFRMESWLPKGIFGGIPEDDFSVILLVPTGDDRLRKPFWASTENCVDCRQCLEACPRGAVKRRLENDAAKYGVNDSRCIGCGICVAICPKSVWTIADNS